MTTPNPVSHPEPTLVPVVAFMFLALALSWGLWIPTIASQHGWIEARIPVMPWGSFGPSIAAILVAARLRGVGALLRPIHRFRARMVDYAIAILAPMLVLVLAAAADLVAKGDAPAFANLDKLWMAPLLWIVILIVGGPLGEEMGWRGFALPRLLSRVGPLGSSLVIALMWLVWHLPLFWLEGAAQKGSSIALFAIAVVAFAIVFTWFWIRTEGNLWLAIVIHTSINFTSVGLPAILPSLEKETLMTPVFTSILCVCALVIALRWHLRPIGATKH
ncbi:MAG: CPBP family intramembrane metalloprotease [Thermoanaerobaculia bacterium]|nr:CPBP family intramembrane metalloprotease [Thermoanaerobaculia bacterium]